MLFQEEGINIKPSPLFHSSEHPEQNGVSKDGTVLLVEAVPQMGKIWKMKEQGDPCVMEGIFYSASFAQDKASDYDNSDPVAPRQNVVPSTKDRSTQQGFIILFSLHSEEYYNPSHGKRFTLLAGRVSLIQIIQKKSTSQESFLWIKEAPKPVHENYQTSDVQSFTKRILFRTQIHQSRKRYTIEATKQKLDVDLKWRTRRQSDYRSKIGSLMYLTSSRRRLNASNADIADPDTRKTRLEGYSSLGDTLVNWDSKKQN
ncbi:hypothetical protein Tco_0877869 [Tanacetum coccineum]|uniref:Uncharacterized protein n=1 Tax=Tanacetum coccineum TaxID=301880 RepID=A0ABQ5BXX6_9ASTR